MKYLIRYFVDFIVLAFLYVFFFFKKWKRQGRDVLLVNTLMYAYLSLLLFFTLMPVIASIPFMFDHPFGFLFPLTRDKRARFGVTVLFCFLLSFGIELLQPFFDRTSDITDLITNVIGGALGYGLYAIFKPIILWLLKPLKRR